MADWGRMLKAEPAWLTPTIKAMIGRRVWTDLLTGTWNINANGEVGEWVIASVTGRTQVTGTVLGDPFAGTWNGYTNEIVFTVISERTGVRIFVTTFEGIKTGPSFAGEFFTISSSPEWLVKGSRVSGRVPWTAVLGEECG